MFAKIKRKQNHSDIFHPESPNSLTKQEFDSVAFLPETDENEIVMQNVSFDRDDKYGRIDFANQLNRIIHESDEFKENQSFTIAIDASWGMGKTQFIHMWRNMLRIEKGYQTVYYNSWKYDDYTDAFTPLVCNICKEYDENNKKSSDILDITKKILKFSLSGIARIACAATPGLEALSDIGRDVIDIFSEEKAENFYKDFREKENAKNEFRKVIKDSINGKGKLIIFIDELDRCRPTFAVETLEIMKHFFNVKNVVFVFALDIKQLSKSIETIYGNGMNSFGYLSRFFDMIFQLDKPNAAQILDSLEPNIFPNDGESIKVLNSVIRVFNLSAREAKILLRIYNRFRKMTSNLHGKGRGGCFFFVLLVLKYKDPNSYDAIIDGNWVKIKSSEYLHESGIGAYLEYAMQLTSLDYVDAIKNMEQRLKTSNDTDGIAYQVSRFLIEDIISSKDEKCRFGKVLHKRIEMFAAEVNKGMQIL